MIHAAALAALLLADAASARHLHGKNARMDAVNPGEKYCADRNSVADGKAMNDPWLYCGCSKNGLSPAGEPTGKPGVVTKDIYGEDACVAASERRQELCEWAAEAQTPKKNNKKGAQTFCVPNAANRLGPLDPPNPETADPAEAAAANPAEAAAAVINPAKTEAAEDSAELAPVTLNSACTAAVQNRIALTCKAFTKQSSEACQKAYTDCLPAIAEAVTNGLPYAGCVKGKCSWISGKHNVEWDDGTYCCPLKQDEPAGCESQAPAFEGWPHCCVLNESPKKCAAYSYNAHPKLEYYHTRVSGGQPRKELYCCPDDPAIGARLQREADEAAAAAIEAQRLAEEEEKLAKAAVEAAEKARKQKAADDAARAAKAAEKLAAKEKKAAEKAEKKRLRLEAQALREKERAELRREVAEAKDAAKRKKAEERRVKLEEKEKAATAAHALAEKNAQAKSARQEMEQEQDRDFENRGCMDNSVFEGLFGRGPRKKFADKKECPVDRPTAEEGMKRVGKDMEEASEENGKHWCCMDGDWRKQCILDCKAKGETEPGNPCFTACRVDVLYGKVDGAAAEDPEKALVEAQQ
jgi:hypothetical protein